MCDFSCLAAKAKHLRARTSFVLIDSRIQHFPTAKKSIFVSKTYRVSFYIGRMKNRKRKMRLLEQMQHQQQQQQSKIKKNLGNRTEKSLVSFFQNCISLSLSCHLSSANVFIFTGNVSIEREREKITWNIKVRDTFEVILKKPSSEHSLRY